MTKLTIPDGWKLEPYSENKGYEDYFVLRSPDPHNFTCTLAFEKDEYKRGYRSGFSTSGPLTSTKNYSRHGWRQVLVNSAVDYLSGLL